MKKKSAKKAIPRKFSLWKFTKRTIGYFFLIIGIVGVIMPLLNGIFFIVLGVLLLESAQVNSFVNKFLHKFNKDWDIEKFLNPRFRKDSYKNYKIFLMPIRYFILLLLMLSLPLIYLVLSPLTIASSSFLLSLAFKVLVLGEYIIVEGVIIQIVPACVAGSAYLLLLILNLTVPMDCKKRFFTILISFAVLFGLNVARIIIFSVLLVLDFMFFDISHALSWYFLSILFIVGIWLFLVQVFKIWDIPIFSDIKFLVKNIKKKS
jgi:hypothetical protein